MFVCRRVGVVAWDYGAGVSLYDFVLGRKVLVWVWVQGVWSRTNTHTHMRTLTPTSLY